MTSRENSRLLVWTIIASQFGPPFMFSGVAVALPTLGADLGAGATSLGLVETSFLAGSVALLLPVGRLADAGDKRKLYELGLLSFVVTSLVIGTLSWIPAILVMRFLQGVTAAIFAATGPAILADVVPAHQRGRAYGSSLAAIYAGLTLGPIVAGFLVDLWGWRAVFFGGAAMISWGWIVVRRLLAPRWRRPESGVHLPSATLIVVAVLALVGGSATLRHGALGYVLLASGLVLGAAFVLLQRRIPRPLLDVRALARNRVLASALTVQLLLYMSAFASIFMLSICMQVSLGAPARTAGQVIAIGSVLMAISAPIAGRLSDRFRPGAIATIGVVGVLVSALLATRLHQSSPLVHVAFIVAIQGLGFAFFSSPNMTIIMGGVPPAEVGTASALGAKARSLGMIAGMLVTAILISLAMGNDPVEEHPDRVVHTVVTAFGILAALDVLALVVSVRTRRAT